MYDASKPDNLAIDKDGGVWFGTDGNFANNGVADSLYYLDLNPAHAGRTYGKGFRFVSVPSDAEATGPQFSPDMRTLFMSVQHPGEFVYSAWP
jgi:secreted PhoX family phosphatase